MSRTLATLTITTLLLTVIALCCAPAIAHSGDDQKMAAGLRELRLFDLAQTFIQRELGDETLSPRRRALLTIELIRTHSDQAYQSKPAEQAIHWKAANEVADNFLSSNVEHPFARLIQTQQALTKLSRAILQRQSSQTELALQEIRTTTKSLESLEKQIGDDLTRSSKTIGIENGLSEQQLQSLRNNVRYNIAKAYTNRAQLYDDAKEADQLNRIDALNRVREQLDALQTSVARSDSLWAQALVDRLRCLRLQKDFTEFDSALKTLAESKTELGSAVQREIEAEILRAAIDRNDIDQLKKLLTDKATASESAELTLARVEGILAIATNEKESQKAAQYQQLAVSLTDALEKRHGTYWSRRANNMLVNSASRNPASVDLSLLVRVADAAYLKGDFESAISAYQSAAAQAAEKKDLTQQFDLLFKATLIQHQLRNFEESAKRFQTIAIERTDHPQAARAHLLAIVGTSEQARKDSTLVNEYIRLLRQQIEKWPNQEPTNQARIWYAAIQSRQQNPLGAIETLVQVPIDSAVFVTAIRDAQQRAERLLEASDSSENHEKTARIFAPVYRDAFSEKPAPANSKWWGRAVSAKIMSKLGFGLRESDKKVFLSGLKSDDPLPWELGVAIRSILVYEFAKEGDEQFVAVASELVEADPQSAMLAIQRILDSEKISSDIATQLPTIISQLRKNESELNENLQSILLTLDARVAAASSDEKRAIELFEELLNNHPRDLPIRIEYAALLSNSADSKTQQLAITQWRTIAKATKPRSAEWFQAKYHVALSLYQAGEKEKARDFLVYLKEIPPGWARSVYKDKFEALLKISN